MDKRQGQRLDHPVMVSYRSVDRFLADFGTNISQGGVFVNAKDPLPVGHDVHLLISLPGQSEPFEVVGRVARVQTAEEGDPGMGVEFTSLDEDARRRLDDLVETLRRHLGP